MTEDTQKADGGGPHEEDEKTDSATEVNFSSGGRAGSGVGLWDNPRIVVGIRCDSGLYSAAKPVLKANFGSVCRAVEAFFASVLGCAETQVNFGNTVEIGKIVIERNIRPRRMLDPDPVKVAVISQEADVDVWVRKVLEAMPVPRGTMLGPVYDAIRAVDVPGPLQVDVRDAVIEEMSRI